MKKTIITLFAIAFVVSNLYAQKNYNNWVFGDGAWIYFPDAVSGPSFVERAAINQVEGCTAYSDDSGNLLFYSDGQTVWNKNHISIINGTGLKGSWTASQGAFIFPIPGAKDKLYIIGLGATERSNEHAYYSIIDYSKGYDKAEVIDKNKLLNDSYDGERATVIKKPDKPGYWLILDDVAFPKYLIYDVSPSGISLFSTYNGIMNKQDNHGVVKISPNSNLIISVNSDNPEFEICRFNPFKGIIYESMMIKSADLGKTVHGADFSPNNRYAYISSNKRDGSGWTTILNQFDIIEYFKTKDPKLSNIVWENFNWRIASKEAVELAPNNKVYIASPETNYISCINSPNSKYPDCNYEKQAVDLNKTRSMLGLPSRVVKPIIKYIFLDTVVCEGSEFEYDSEYGASSFWLTPNKGVINGPKLTIKNFSELDTGYYHLYDENSELRLVLHLDYISNDIFKFVEAIPDIYFCPGDSVLIKTNDDVEKIIWGDGSTSKSFYVKEPGKYKFTVFLKNGCVLEDEIDIYIKNIRPVISTNDSHCELGYGVLYTREKFYKYEWSDGSTNDSLIVYNSGKYWLKVTSFDGCIGYDTIDIEIKNVEKFDILPDSISFCPEELAEYRILNDQLFKSIAWSHGKFGSITYFAETGEYSIVAIDLNGCPHYDTVFVTIHESFKIEFEILENYYCVRDSGFVKLKDRDNTVFTWYDGKKDKSRFFKQVGTFRVTAIDTITGCSQKEEINFNNYPFITAKIIVKGNQNPCSGQPIVLRSRYLDKSYNYYWNGELGEDSLVVLKSGTYSLVIINEFTGCTDSTSIDVEFADQMNISLEGNDICKGDEAIINVIPYDSTLTYLWSTTESTPSIKVTKAGKYTLIATNGTCSDTAEIVIKEYPAPSVTILGNTEICNGTNTTLSTDKEFDKYLWSTGESSESIEVDKPGIYNVEVTDSNGCKAETEFEVRQYLLNIALSKNSFDFGKLYIGETKLDNITIYNKLDQEIRFEFLQNKNIVLKDEFVIKEYFEAKELGEFQDTIWLNITYPCDSSFYITKKAEVYAIATVSTTDINSKIGQKINIPFYIKGPSEIGNLNFEVKTEILHNLFYANNGYDINANMEITQDKTLFHSMPGTLLLTDVVTSPIDYVSVTSDNKYVEFKTVPGRITVESICVFDFRNIIILNDLEIITNTQNGNLNILLKSVEPSEYRFEIYSLEGSLLISQTENISQLDYEKQIGTKQLSSGIYLLRVSSPYKSITRKILITE